RLRLPARGGGGSTFDETQPRAAPPGRADDAPRLLRRGNRRTDRRGGAGPDADGAGRGRGAHLLLGGRPADGRRAGPQRGRPRRPGVAEPRRRHPRPAVLHQGETAGSRPRHEIDRRQQSVEEWSRGFLLTTVLFAVTPAYTASRVSST